MKYKDNRFSLGGNFLRSPDSGVRLVRVGDPGPMLVHAVNSTKVVSP